MISANMFREQIESAFVLAGFSKANKTVRYDGAAGAVLIGIQKISTSSQYAINIGFWLYGLGEECPDKVELTHLYFRMERLFPDDRGGIVSACDLTQPEFLDVLCEQIRGEYAKELMLFVGDISTIRDMYSLGRFTNGLIRKEARSFLEAK